MHGEPVSSGRLKHRSALYENALCPQHALPIDRIPSPRRSDPDPRRSVMPGLILVIEDEPGIVDFLERGLAAHGFEVVSVPDGDTGIEQALVVDVDLVVLDMMLPGRSGLEVLERLREARPTVPVIVLTA